MITEYNKLELYIVQNREGKFFRAKGYGGYGDTWVTDINKAKVYTKIGQARSRVTWFNNNYPEFGVPLLVKLTVGGHEVIDETERVMKAFKKKGEEKAVREKNQRLADYKLAERDFKLAEERLKKLRS